MLLRTSSWMLFCCTPQKAISFIWTKYLLCQILGPLLFLQFDASTLFILHDTMSADMASCWCQQMLMNNSLYTCQNLQEVLICFIADALVILGTHVKTHNLKDCNYWNVTNKNEGGCNGSITIMNKYERESSIWIGKSKGFPHSVFNATRYVFSRNILKIIFLKRHSIHSSRLHRSQEKMSQSPFS